MHLGSQKKKLILRLCYQWVDKKSRGGAARSFPHKCMNSTHFAKFTAAGIMKLKRGVSLDLAKQLGNRNQGLGTGNSKDWILSLREPIPRQRDGGTAGEWLRGLDSNQDSRLQRPMCYQLHHPGVVDNEGQRHWRPDTEGKVIRTAPAIESPSDRPNDRPGRFVL